MDKYPRSAVIIVALAIAAVAVVTTVGQLTGNHVFEIASSTTAAVATLATVGVVLDRARRIGSDYSGQAEALRAKISKADEESSERQNLERQLEDVQVSASFENEGRSAFWVSWMTFTFGVMISLGIVGFGIWEWSSAEETALSTGTGIARVGVIAAAFYAAGQLFRRSTTLQIRSQEFSRAAIAMNITDNLAERIKDDGARDAFLVAVYQHHLTGTAADAPSGDAGGGPDIVKLADAAAKLKGV